MRTLELKDICGYLPYGLIVTFKGDEYEHELAGLNIYNRGAMLISAFGDSGDAEIKNTIPLLLPLSAITEQLPDGSVPIERIAIYPSTKSGIDYLIEQIKTGLVEKIVWDMLLEMHFDVFSLIDSGLAIDKRTVKT